MNYKVKSAKVHRTETQITQELIKEEALEIIPFALADIERMRENKSVEINRICYPCEGEFKNFWLIYEVEAGKFTKIQYKQGKNFKFIKL
jgi:hypothetical protein